MWCTVLGRIGVLAAYCQPAQRLYISFPMDEFFPPASSLSLFLRLS